MRFAVDRAEPEATVELEDRPREGPEADASARETAQRLFAVMRVLAQRVRAALAVHVLERIGAAEPVRPAFVHYPDAPTLPATVGLKIAFALALGVVIGSLAATELVAAAAHGASALGRPIASGIYFPTDYFAWLRFERPLLARADALSLNAAGATPAELHEGFVRGRVAIGIGTGCGIVLALVAASRRQRVPRALAGLKGSAEWASYADVKRAGLVWDGSTPGVFLGYLERPPFCGVIARALVPLVYGGPRHILHKGSSRSGKDVGPITTSAVVTWHERNRNAPGCSILWNDPKGEGHVQTSGTRRALFKNNIVLFAPLARRIGEKYIDLDEQGGRVEREERFGSTRWNPLAEIPLGTDYEFSDMLQIATLVVDPTGALLDSDQGHWTKTSRTVIKALAIKVLYDPLEPIKSLSRVADLFGSAGGGPASEEHSALHRDTDGASAGTIEELLEQYLGFSATGLGGTPSWLQRSFEDLRLRAEREIMLKRERIGIDVSEVDALRYEAERRRTLDQHIERIRTQMRHPDLERDLRNALRIRGDEASSVYSTVNANLTPWLDPAVIRNTSFSDAKILDLVTLEHPTTWYVVSSVARADMAFPVVKLFWTLAYRKLVPQMEMDGVSKRTKSPWKHRLLCLMNERGSLKKIEVEQEVVPVAASYGMLFDYFFQTPRQLREIGGENDVIGPNCGIHVEYTPQEQEDEEALSKRLGNKTVQVESPSYSQGHLTRSWQTEQMPLLWPEQTALIPSEPVFRWTTDADGEPVVAETIRPAYQVIFAPNCRPIYSRKAQWFANPKLRELIAATAPVVPYPLRADHTRKILFAADEQSRTTPHRIETSYRSKARVEEAVRLERIDLPEAPPSSQPPAAPPPTDGGSPVAVQRKRRIVAFDQRLVERVRQQSSGEIGRGFEAILDGEQRSR